MKKWYLSKTIWVNILALIGVSLETATGKQILDPETQGVILTVINLILRFVTKQGITFKTIVDAIKPDAAAPISVDSTPKPDPQPIEPVKVETPQPAQETPQTTQPPTV